MKKFTHPLLTIIGLLLLTFSVSTLAGDQPKTASMKGKVFRSDTNQPIANAEIVLLDEKKSEEQNYSIDTKTDDQGHYSFPKRNGGCVYSVHPRVVSNSGRRALSVSAGKNC